MLSSNHTSNLLLNAGWNCRASENCMRPPAHVSANAPSLCPPPPPSPLFLPRPDSRLVSSLRQSSTCYHSTLFLEASVESKPACAQDAATRVLAVATGTSLACLFLCIHWYWSFTQQKHSISAAPVVHYEITSHESKLERLHKVPGRCHKHRSLGSSGNKPTIH